MPSSIHPFIRNFQSAREATGVYQDDSNRNQGYKLYKNQETLNKVVPQPAKPQVYWFGRRKISAVRGVSS